MMRLVISFLVAGLLCMNPAFARKKASGWDRNWQTGKILDSQRSQNPAGTVDVPGKVLGNGVRISNDSKRIVYAIQDNFVIEGDNYTYTVSEPLGGVKPANLTVNGPVRFAIDGTALYLIDDDYKELDTTGHFTILHSFTDGADGLSPNGVVLDSAGNLYGTTGFGGAANGGVVFKLDTAGHQTVLYSFTGGADGRSPWAGPFRDSAGNLYGTTFEGGGQSGGVLFKIKP